METGHRVAEAHAGYFASLAARLSKCPYGPQESGSVATVDLEFDNIRAAFAWCVAEGKWDVGMHLLDSVVPELVLRGRIEIGRWATETLATLGEKEHAVRRGGAGCLGQHGLGRRTADGRRESEQGESRS